MILSIEIQDKKINIVQALKKGKLLSILSCQNIDITSVIDEDRFFNTDDISNKIKQVLSENNIKTKKVIFVINSNSIIIRKRKLPLLKNKSETISMITHELELSMSVDISQYKIIYKIIPNDNSDKCYYVIYCLPIKLFNQYAEIATKLKLKSFRLEIYCNCLNKILSHQTIANDISINDNNIIAFVDIGKSKIIFSVLNNGVCDFSRISEFNDSITGETAAEDYGDYAAGGNYKPDEFMYRCLDEISKYIRYYHSADYENNIKKLYVFGTFFNNNLLDFLSANLNNSIFSVDSISNVQVKKVSYNYDFDINSNFIQMLSLFNDKNDKNDICFCRERNYINFLNSNINASVAAAVIALFVFIGTMILFEIMIDDFNEKKVYVSNYDNIKLNDEIEKVKKDIADLESYLESVKALQSSAYEDDFVSSEICRQIYNAVPGNTSVTSVSIDKNNTHITCVSGSIDEVTLFLYNLRKIYFVESIYVPNVEVTRDINGNYLYSVVCVLKDVNKIDN